jgi:hypothetical protein
MKGKKKKKKPRPARPSCGSRRLVVDLLRGGLPRGVWAQSDDEILPARPSGDSKSLEGKKKKNRGSARPNGDPSSETQRRVLANPRPTRSFLLPSSFLFFLFSFLLHRGSRAGGCRIFFCIFFSLFVKCQHVSGGQKIPLFCPIRIEVIFLIKLPLFKEKNIDPILLCPK